MRVHGPMGIVLQGVPVDTVTTGVDQFVTRTYQVVISARPLDLGPTNQSSNGRRRRGGIDALSIVLVPPPVPTMGDFGTSSSPVAWTETPRSSPEPSLPGENALRLDARLDRRG